MDLFSFTNLIIISFVIIGGYILLTSQIEGRARIVLILSVTIAFFVILFNLPMFKSFSEGVNYPKLTSETIKPIDNYTISPSYSLSMWIYISDWNDKLGKEKIICKRTQQLNNTTSVDNPKIYLDTYSNVLKIKFNTVESATITQNDPIEIPNISIQKWVNIVVCFGDNKVDTYINGKLEKSTITQFPQFVLNNNKPSVQPFIFTPADTTYTGYISNTRYYGYFLSPQEVWEIYKDGFSENLLGNFLNQYNAAFIFYENQNEKAKFYLM
jgi:hypothetical protein